MNGEQIKRNNPSYPKRALNKTKRMISLLLLLIIITGGVYLLIQKSEKMRSIFGIKPKTEQEAVSRYLAQLGKLMVIPKDDTPILATVEDPELLIKQQAFFQGSIKGDVVLIFPKTSRAVLFSPSKDIILNAGPVIQNQENQNQQSASNTKSQS